MYVMIYGLFSRALGVFAIGFLAGGLAQMLEILITPWGTVYKSIIKTDLWVLNDHLLQWNIVTGQ